MMLQFGMPGGFQALLDRKYAIMQQQADTARIGVDAAARLDNARATLLPGESEANIAESRARTTNLGLTGQTIVPLANSTIGLQSAQARGLDADTDLTRENTVTVRNANRRRPLSSFGLTGGSLTAPYRLGL